LTDKIIPTIREYVYSKSPWPYRAPFTRFSWSITSLWILFFRCPILTQFQDVINWFTTIIFPLQRDSGCKFAYMCYTRIHDLVIGSEEEKALVKAIKSSFPQSKLTVRDTLVKIWLDIWKIKLVWMKRLPSK
jgi:hypothetical protein